MLFNIWPFSNGSGYISIFFIKLWRNSFFSNSVNSLYIISNNSKNSNIRFREIFCSFIALICVCTVSRFSVASAISSYNEFTGKTYVYIKTMFELNKKYGWSKFIVVVPSIAIREGVKKSFEITADHFMEHYGKKARFFIYNSSNLNQLDNFSWQTDRCHKWIL